MIEKLLKLNPLCAKARPSPARPTTHDSIMHYSAAAQSIRHEQFPPPPPQPPPPLIYHDKNHVCRVRRCRGD
jgi:hypothetical protein